MTFFRSRCEIRRRHIQDHKEIQDFVTTQMFRQILTRSARGIARRNVHNWSGVPMGPPDPILGLSEVCLHI